MTGSQFAELPRPSASPQHAAACPSPRPISWRHDGRQRDPAFAGLANLPACYVAEDYRRDKRDAGGELNYSAD